MSLCLRENIYELCVQHFFIIVFMSVFCVLVCLWEDPLMFVLSCLHQRYFAWGGCFSDKMALNKLFCPK